MRRYPEPQLATLVDADGTPDLPRRVPEAFQMAFVRGLAPGNTYGESHHRLRGMLFPGAPRHNSPGRRKSFFIASNG